MRDGFTAHGFRLATAGPTPRGPAILEAFPHIAVLALLGATRRVPYKVARSGQYWPDVPGDVRRARIRHRWASILAALRRRIDLSWRLPRTFGSFALMKRYEDALDAIVCAWLAIEYLDGRAEALGDATAAIWAPREA
jgi:predicted RNase H-like nuclease